MDFVFLVKFLDQMCSEGYNTEVLRRSRQRWCGHVKREDEHVLRGASQMEVEGVKRRERLNRHGSDKWKRM